MTDWMDDLLSNLPPETCAPDLARNVQRRLAAARRRARVARAAGRVATLGAAMVGGWILAPRVERLGALPLALPVEDLGAWVKSLAASPAPTIWQLVVQTVDREPALAAGLGLDGALAILLLSASAFWALRGLIGPQAVKNGGTP